MESTQNGLGNDNPQLDPHVIESVSEITAAPEPITMAGVQAMVQTMLDQQMEETKRLLQQSKVELTVPVRQIPTLEITIGVAKAVEEVINGGIANKKNSRKSGEEVTCFKCGKHGHYADECPFNERVCYECNEEGHFKQDCPKREEHTKPNVPLKHYERCDEEVTCYKCGKTGHYANKCVSKKRVCYKCREERHLSKDFPKKKEGARLNALSQPKA
ncbi:uncharacterized protein LOC128134215 [Lactuca sativa]|uniref:uncharacterized protein LOC128134215 n=1 Tax=Lactuca sativa TaxID=4236 RepID=UPI0022AE7EDC|nr:uncharacterized protein LOC128134215 [Lactuca sativa]